MADYMLFGNLIKGLFEGNEISREIKNNGYTEKVFDILEKNIIQRKQVIENSKGNLSDYSFYYMAVKEKVGKYMEAGRFEDALATFERLPWEDFLHDINYPGVSVNNMSHMQFIGYGVTLYLMKNDMETANQIYQDTPKHFQYFRKHADLGHVNAIFAESYLFYKQGDYDKAKELLGSCKKKAPAFAYAMVKVLEGKVDEKINGGNMTQQYYSEAKSQGNFPGIEKMIIEL